MAHGSIPKSSSASWGGEDESSSGGTWAALVTEVASRWSCADVGGLGGAGVGEVVVVVVVAGSWRWGRSCNRASSSRSITLMKRRPSAS